jgi:hypothetical protein
VRGPLRAHAEAVIKLFQCARLTALGKSLRHFRFLNELNWRELSGSRMADGFDTLFHYPGDEPGNWGVQLVELTGADPNAFNTSFELVDLAPALGIERCSYIRLIFDARTAFPEIASFANWTINNLPIWWGTAGWFFHHTGGRSTAAYAQIAARAKRYQGVQIQDLTALQWDSLNGMPGVNWLNLIGEGFAATRDMDLNVVASKIASPKRNVFHRKGNFGVVVAAGSKPLMGDVNRGEDMAAYSEVANLLSPLLLAEHTPLSGPFERPEVMSDWLGRFSDPQAWRECDISS